MVRRWEGEAEGSGGKRASRSSEVAVTAQGTRTVMGPEEGEWGPGQDHQEWSSGVWWLDKGDVLADFRLGVKGVN